MVIGERIRERREVKKLKQSELAEIIGNDGNTISRWEHNKIGIGSKYITKLAQALDTSTDYLLGKTDDPQTPYIKGQILALAEKIRSEDSDLKEPITAGMTDNMIIIKDWNTKQTICFPNNEEGRKSFIAFMNYSLAQKMQTTQHVESTIQGDNNTHNNLGIVNERSSSWDYFQEGHSK